MQLREKRVGASVRVSEVCVCGYAMLVHVGSRLHSPALAQYAREREGLFFVNECMCACVHVCGYPMFVPVRCPCILPLVTCLDYILSVCTGEKKTKFIYILCVCA